MDEPSVEQILARLRDGDQSARDDLLGVVYGQLRAMAGRQMAGQDGTHTLQPTALVHEAYLKLFGSERQWQDRTHFLAAAATAMRTILVDHARARRTQKRAPDGERVPLDELIEEFARRGTDVADLGDALARLEQRDPQLARLVELRFFGGCTLRDTANALGISQSGVVRGWRVARAWLKREIEGG